MIVVGIDPSLTATGLAVGGSHGPGPGDIRPWDCQTIVTKSVPAKDPQMHTKTLERLERITTSVVGYVNQHSANIAVMEVPIYGALRGTHAADRGGLWWMIARALRQNSTPVAFCPQASRQKYATGKGNAGKAQVMAAAIRRYASAPIADDNQADAVVMASMVLHWLGEYVEPVPTRNTEALDAMEWPPGYEHRRPYDVPLIRA